MNFIDIGEVGTQPVTQILPEYEGGKREILMLVTALIPTSDPLGFLLTV
jgi:hypothetical protein